jgi:monovalent cation:H+ antiporter-2, CPA2 family
MQVEFLQSLVIIFGVSAIVVFLLNKFKIPSPVGFLLSGILIGPHALGLISELNEIEVFAEVGVILLLFTLGMEFSLKKLLKMKRVVFGAGSFQIFFTILVIFIIGIVFFKLDIVNAIFWGFLIVVSSTAIIIKLISDKKETSSPQGRAMIGISLFQDLSIIFFIVLIPLMSGSVEFSFFQFAIIILKAAGVIFFVIYGSKWIVPYLFNQVVKSKSRELFIISIILFCIGTALFTSFMGLSLSLGAFLAGVMISESDYAYQAMSDVVPFKESFMGLFFVSIGMILDLSIAVEYAQQIIILLLIIVVVKFIIGLIAVRIAGFSLRTAIIAGIGIAQVGEFSFILALEGRYYGILKAENYQIFIATSILSLLLIPLLYKFAHPFATWFVKKVNPQYFGKHNISLYKDDFLSRDSKTDHVVIVGYGFNGRNLANILRYANVPYVVLDFDMNLVKQYKAKGEPIYYGDATSPDVLLHLGLKKAKMLVCSVSDSITQRIVIANARNVSKCLYIVARTRYVSAVEELKKMGQMTSSPKNLKPLWKFFTECFYIIICLQRLLMILWSVFVKTIIRCFVMPAKIR